jgi:hypothetical protein
MHTRRQKKVKVSEITQIIQKRYRNKRDTERDDLLLAPYTLKQTNKKKTKIKNQKGNLLKYGPI